MRKARIAAALVPIISLGCGGNEPPKFDRLSEQTAQVEREFSLALHATDEDDDELTFSFAADSPELNNRGSITPTTPGFAVFRWMPLYPDLGPHLFDFSVSDGEETVTQTVSIRVGLAGEGSTSPVFVQPLGTGTTLTLETQTCLEVPVVVEDPDSPSVVLSEEEPRIAGASLAQESELSGRWSWCPSVEQIEASDRYTLVLSADDQDNAKTIKNYLIVLRAGSKPDCPGAAPVVNHAPQDIQSVVDLTIGAQVSDDLGIKYEPLFYYSTTPPASPPNLGEMTMLTMELVDGTMQDGTWTASVPNPVANQPQGSTAQLYYLIVAEDNDDAEGNCDHITQVPTTGTFQITVTNSGGSGGLGLCELCSADVQCGEAGDNCIFLDGAYHCFRGCTDDAQCPDGYYCSLSEFTSIDDAVARQCIPNNYLCDGGSGCTDDAYEDNDSLQEAQNDPALTSGSYPGLKICPAHPSGEDEDWFKIQVGGDTQIDVSIAGGSSSDLDLDLVDANGGLIDSSDSLSSNEQVVHCVTAGTYFVRIHAWSDDENTYDLNLALSSMACSGQCDDDPDEDDDNESQARFVDLNNPPYTSTTNAICAWDDDWYEMLMFTGETLYVDLTFTQGAGDEDLDVYVYRGGLNLTGCTEATPFGCDPNNGQSGTSNEHLEWPIDQNDTYYVVVHGWQGSENLYDICIGYEPDHCP